MRLETDTEAGVRQAMMLQSEAICSTLVDRLAGDDQPVRDVPSPRGHAASPPATTIYSEQVTPRSDGSGAVRACNYPIYVINLEHDVDRLTRVTKWYRTLGLELTRIPGVRGAYLPMSVRNALIGRNRSIQSGTFGCFLSHMVAWETIAAGEAEWAFVIEDDAQPLRPFPVDVAELNLPDDADLCYANFRMSTLQRNRPPAADLPRIATLEYMLAHRDEAYANTGLDGYFLRKSGAKRILSLLEADKILGHVDVQLIATGLSRPTAEALGSTGKFRGTVKRYNLRRSSRDHITSYVLTEPLVRQNDVGYSSHQTENRVTERAASM